MLDLRPRPRRQSPSIEQQLDGAVDALDRLIAEVRGGIRGPAHYDQLESEARAIGDRLQRAFRK